MSPDPGLASQTRSAFAGSGAELLQARSLDQAQVHLRRDEPALILAEVGLPGGSGYEFSRLALDLLPGAKVVLLHSSADPFSSSKLNESGAHGSLRRPFLPVQLREEVARVIGAHFLEDSDEDYDSGELPGLGFDAVELLSTRDLEGLRADSGVEARSIGGADLSRTGELPGIAIEELHEDLIAAAAAVNAAVLPSSALDSLSAEAPAEEDLGTDSEIALWPVSGVLQTLQAQAGQDEAIERALRACFDEMLAPGGALAQAIEERVSRSVAAALPALVEEIHAAIRDREGSES